MRMICLMALVIVLASFGVAREAPEGTDVPTKKEVTLTVAMMLDAKKPTLVFTVTNNRTEPRPATPIMTNDNRLVITDPAGKKHEIYMVLNWFRVPVTIPACGQVSWTVELTGLFEEQKMTAPGLYHLVWSYEGLLSDEVLLLKGEPPTTPEGAAVQ